MMLSASVLDAQKLTILHVNDTHSHIDPERSGDYKGRGGVIEQAAFIDSVRLAEGRKNVLLLHAGDFSQGTSYFTELGGDVEIDLLNAAGYDVVTLGNHEFDNGVDTLASVLRDAKFAVVSTNYDVQNTPLEDIVRPYVVVTRAGVRVGILGVGVNPKGLIADKNFYPLRYLEPIPVVQKVADELKKHHKCDVVICLSHLGTDALSDEQISDVALAKATRNIDVIVGGHTHKLVTNRYVENLDGDSVLLSQMGKSGARIGKILLKIAE